MSTIVITGANRGIGLSLARCFRERGETVVAACRRASTELKDLGVEVVEDVDVTSDASVERLAAALGDRRVDLLVLNAGILTRETLDDLDFGRIQRQLEVNSIGPLRVIKALLGRLGDGSKIAIVTSRMGSIGDNTSGSSYGYRMSKAAVNMAGVSLAHDLAPRGVAVVILHPGFVQTEMTRGAGNMTPDESAALLVERMDALTLETTGRFLHANGDPLPW